MKARDITLAGAAILLLYGASCNGFRRDEIECERAVVHLGDCCPHFDATRIDCSYEAEHDCSGATVGHRYPAYSEDDSACILAKSCDALATLCDELQAKEAVEETIQDGGARTTENGGRVCR